MKRITIEKATKKILHAIANDKECMLLITYGVSIATSVCIMLVIIK